jgi:hypothetical protein
LSNYFKKIIFRDFYFIKIKRIKEFSDFGKEFLRNKKLKVDQKF